MAPNSKPNLSDAVRNNVAQFLLTHWNETKQKLRYGAIQEAHQMFQISPNSVHAIWNNSKELMSLGLPIYLTNKKRGMIRQKTKVFDQAFFISIALKKKKTLRSCAKALSVSHATVMRWKEAKLIRRHTSAIRVTLTALQILARLKFCLAAIEVDSSGTKLVFKSMEHTIHIDEKWFYLTRTAETYYLSEDEPIPHRHCVNKNYIIKIMFLCAVCRPIYDMLGNEVFDGKIGMYPFIKEVEAARNSINRPRGTKETKAIESITRVVTKDFMINKVLPDIKALWPATEHKVINIQQDNAPAHFSDDDPEWRAAASSDGFDIHLVNQPSKSPDLNCNDLGWFRALQSLQEETSCDNVDELVAAVLGSFEELEPKKLNFVYLSLQSVMIEIMKRKGKNDYALPHMGKEKLLREGRLPINLEVEAQLVQECVDYLREAGMENEIQPMVTKLFPLVI